MLSCDCLFHVLVPYKLKYICLFYDAVSEKKTTILGSVLVSYNKSKISLGAPPPPGSPAASKTFDLWFFLRVYVKSVYISEATAGTLNVQLGGFSLDHSVHS